MKQLTRYYTVFLTVIALFSGILSGLTGTGCKITFAGNASAYNCIVPVPPSPLLDETDENPSERVILITDRSLYITGERVYFSAYLLRGHLAGDEKVSIVLYSEIITPDGKSIQKGKFPVEDQKSTGYLDIPAEVITGVYYLRAYTRIMRNQGPGAYSYLRIRIINPYKTEVLGGDDTATSGSSQTFNSIGSEQTPNSPVTIKLKPVNNSYSTGEMISLLAETSSSDSSLLMVNVAVIPKYTYSRIPTVPSISNANLVTSDMCMENRGLSISGVLKESENGQPVIGRRINLSVIGNGKDFMAMDSDHEGRFYFTLPALTGWRDLYLGTTGAGTRQARVFADNDFCSLPVKLPVPVFNLSVEERRVAVSMARNARVKTEFSDSTIREIPLAGTPFYGTPDQILVLSKFVELPTLEEYFNELTGLVKVRTSAGRKYFKVTGIQPEMAIYEPLVLIDHVAVDDFEELLSAPPSLIDRIEMFNQPYLKGDILYGGIVSIISKSGDFAGIDLPASGTFINYRFFNEMENEDFRPDTESPDARNTVYFGILSRSVKGEYIPFAISTPSTKGSYLLIVTTVDKDGNVEENSREILVK